MYSCLYIFFYQYSLSFFPELFLRVVYFVHPFVVEYDFLVSHILYVKLKNHSVLPNSSLSVV